MSSGACPFVGTGISYAPFGAFGNGRGLAIACYNAPPATASVYSTLSRTIVTIDGAANMDASTVFTVPAAEVSGGG